MMNWQKLHEIFDCITSQQAIGALDTRAIDYLKSVLIDVPYRMYYNFYLRGNNALGLLHANDAHLTQEKELRLVKELGCHKCLHPSYFESDDLLNFIVVVDEHCSFLLVIEPQEKEIKPQLIEFIKTLVCVWTNQLALLHYFQTDALTGLFNPNIFTEAVNGNSIDLAQLKLNVNKHHALERRSQDSQLDCIALIKINELVQVNERFSHTVGDEVLMKMARLAEIAFRDGDLLCRFSGRTFAILIRNVSRLKAHEILARFSSMINESHFPRVDKVSVSIGYTIASSGILASELYERCAIAIKAAEGEGEDTIINADDVLPFSTEHNQRCIEIGEIELF